jgi:hypothetical protein
LAFTQQAKRKSRFRHGRTRKSRKKHVDYVIDPVAVPPEGTVAASEV